MVQIYSQQATVAQQRWIDEVTEASRVPVLASTIRNSSRHFGDSGETGVPAMLRNAGKDEVVKEFDQLADEVLGALELSKGGNSWTQ